MLRFILISLLAISLILSACKKGAENPADNTMIEDTTKEKVAKVGNKYMYKEDLYVLIDRYIDQTQQPPVSDSLREIIRQQLFSMTKEQEINKELLFQSATQEDFNTVSDSVLNLNINHTISQFPDSQTFFARLKEFGATFDEYVADVKETLLVQAILNRITNEVDSLPEDSLRTYYTEHQEEYTSPGKVHARHILIKTEESDNQTTRDKKRKQAENLLKRLKSGAEFGTLAKEHSDCPSKNNGGDLGFFSKGEMAPQFEQAAFALNPGQTSNVVETSFGYHIIRIDEKAEAGVMPFDSVKMSIINHFKDQYVMNWLEKQKSIIKVEDFTTPSAPQE